MPATTRAAPASTRSTPVRPGAPAAEHCPGPAHPAAALRLVGLPPHHRRPDQRHPERAGDPAAPGVTERRGGEREAHPERDETDRLLLLAGRPRPTPSVRALRHERPEQPVAKQPHTAEAGEHDEHHPHPQHRHAQVIRDPARHPTDDPPGAPPAEHRARRGLGCRTGRGHTDPPRRRHRGLLGWRAHTRNGHTATRVSHQGRTPGMQADLRVVPDGAGVVRAPGSTA